MTTPTDARHVLRALIEKWNKEKTRPHSDDYDAGYCEAADDFVVDLEAVLDKHVQEAHDLRDALKAEAQLARNHAGTYPGYEIAREWFAEHARKLDALAVRATQEP